MPPLSALRPSLALAACCALLGACQSKAPPPAAVAAVTAPVIVPADGPGCGAAIAHTQGLVDSDVATGNLNAPVGKRFSADLDGARAACAAGRDGEARALLAAAKSRYGYR